jgi:hypothetical protein
MITPTILVRLEMRLFQLMQEEQLAELQQPAVALQRRRESQGFLSYDKSGELIRIKCFW